MRSDRERLLDVLEAIECIEKYAEEGRGVFEANELIQTWIVHHIGVIGTDCRALPAEFQAQHANIAMGRHYRNAEYPHPSLFWN